VEVRERRWGIETSLLKTNRPGKDHGAKAPAQAGGGIADDPKAGRNSDADAP
jgi:hypothetical protein